jgi:iron complex transport system substrate-binding protein
MKFNLFRLMSLILLVTLLTACSPTPVIPQPTPIPASSIILNDKLGHTVTLPVTARRIVSLAPSNTEILFAIGAGSQVVGDTEYCDYPPEAQKLPHVGGFTADSISIETIISLKPDLVVAYSNSQKSVVEALETAKIPVMVLSPRSFDDVYNSIELLGLASGHSTEAATLINQMQTRVTAVTQKVKTIKKDKRPTVFWEIFDEPLMSANSDTFIGQMIEIAGGINIFANLKEEYPQVNSEDVIKLNPAVIMGPDSHANKLTVEQLLNRPGWEKLDAVKNKRIYLVNGNIASRAGPRLVEVLEIIAKTLYPDLFK